MTARRLLLLTLAFVACGSVHALDNSATVCGKSLQDPGAFTWKAYSDLADRLVDDGALRTLLNQNSQAWPPTLSDQVRSAFDAALPLDAPNRRLTMAQFKIGKLGIEGDQFAFPTTAFSFKLPATSDAPECQDPVAAKALPQAASFIQLVQSAHAAAIVNGIKLTSEQINDLEKQYDRYLFEGFPMFPWEAAVNGWLLTDKSIANGPPRKSVVLLHPSAGVVGTVSSGSKSDTGSTLAVEALGMVWYSRDYQSWYGASLLAAFPGDRNAGYGVGFNYNHYKLGVVWVNDKDSNHDGATLFLGMDLLQFVGEQTRKYGNYKDSLRDVILK